jgi:hypothetical membrane protein
MIEPESDRLTRFLVGCGLIAPLVALAVFALAASRAPGYDHAADTISKLSVPGVGDPWVWTSGLIVYSLLMGLFSGGLRRRFTRVPGSGWLWAAILVHAVLMAGVGLFRDDLRPGGFFTWEGAVHDVLSGMAFSALVVAMAATTWMARRVEAMQPLHRLTPVLGGTMTAVGLGFLFTPVAVQGVPQRIFTVLAAAWICSLALQAGGWRRSGTA